MLFFTVRSRFYWSSTNQLIPVEHLETIYWNNIVTPVIIFVKLLVGGDSLLFRTEFAGDSPMVFRMLINDDVDSLSGDTDFDKSPGQPGYKLFPLVGSASFPHFYIYYGHDKPPWIFLVSRIRDV
jgi:hypothetical protein